MKLKARDGGRNKCGLSAGTSCRETKEKEYGKVIILHDKAETAPQSSNISGEAINGQITSFPKDSDRTHISASNTVLSNSKQIELLSNESRAPAHTTARDSVP